LFGKISNDEFPILAPSLLQSPTITSISLKQLLQVLVARGGWISVAVAIAKYILLAKETLLSSLLTDCNAVRIATK